MSRRLSVSPSFFQLTTSRRGRHNNVDTQNHNEYLSTHDLTKRSTYDSTRRRYIAAPFNSRPHEEVDTTICHVWVCIHFLSTHDLTKRSTVFGTKPLSLFSFQLTTSRRGRQTMIISCPTFAVFQLTTSRRGRHGPTSIDNMKDVFQLTTSRRGRQRAEIRYEVTNTFQLTTSRRGRPSLYKSLFSI